MAQNESSKNRSSDEYMRGGKGRRDEVRGSGIYPAGASDVPEDAQVRTPGEFVGHEGGGHKPRPRKKEKK